MNGPRPLSEGLELRATDGGRATLLPVHAKPGSRQSGPAGIHGGALELAARSPAEDGRANEELRATLAALLGLRSSSVALVRGHSSRAKVFRIELTPDEVKRRLDALP